MDIKFSEALKKTYETFLYCYFMIVNMFYSREYTNTPRQLALTLVRGVIDSAYFGQYVLKNTSRLDTDVLRISRIGGIDAEQRTVSDATPYLDALLDQLERNANAQVNEITLHINAPMDIKTRYFSKRMANQLGMEVSIEVRRDSNSSLYDVKIYNMGLSMESHRKSKRVQYEHWQKDMKAQLDRILPPTIN